MEYLEFHVCDKCKPYFEQLSKFYEDKLKEMEERIENLEKRLLAYENAHTPPSKQIFPVREKSSSGKKGRPEGYPGSTRKFRKPDRTINLRSEEHTSELQSR